MHSILSQQVNNNNPSTSFLFEYTSNEMDQEILEMIQSINHSLVYQYHQSLMSFGSRYTGTKNSFDAAKYIFNTFQNMSLETQLLPWNLNGFSSQNIEATIQGTHPNKVTYLISAHYDCTLGSLGADDDGSGVAAILAIAHVMANHTFNNTIKFVAFSGEEVGTYGSFSYARDAYRNQEDIKAVLNIDMIGYADTTEGGKLLRFHCPKRSEWITTKATEISLAYESILDIIVEGRPNYIGADHQAFVDYGYDGVWIAHKDGYPWANSPEDTPDHLNWTYQLKSTKLLCAILAELASEPISLHIQLIKPFEGYAYINNIAIVPLDLGMLWSFELRGITILFGSPEAEALVIHDKPVEYVVFCLNNNFMYFDSSPPYIWKEIKGKHAPPLGSYTLRVYVYATDGEVACDEMQIFSCSLNYHYRPW